MPSRVAGGQASALWNGRFLVQCNHGKARPIWIPNVIETDAEVTKTKILKTT